ncbi:MAG: hypothetical protein NZ901_09720 [Geminocystis sp.]|nr:hypothetical protein [Geminocystis sp.]HIK37157.1 hypothetical protein [Geminocystis sp. M7585_C2015_104]MCS7148451.1 hypothetical protein [Geminocystis sp.]MCX8078233.1 hypothetical protein [Geminocystis sp.]MDW8115962.1 hypothetical protein [Geminocystis sp.]
MADFSGGLQEETLLTVNGGGGSLSGERCFCFTDRQAEVMALLKEVKTSNGGIDIFVMAIGSHWGVLSATAWHAGIGGNGYVSSLGKVDR